MDVLLADPGASSGNYELDLDAEGPEAPLTIECDMDTDGGGWTIITIDVAALALGANTSVVFRVAFSERGDEAEGWIAWAAGKIALR